jgi:hypothetical protein
MSTDQDDRTRAYYTFLEGDRYRTFQNAFAQGRERPVLPTAVVTARGAAGDQAGAPKGLVAEGGRVCGLGLPEDQGITVAIRALVPPILVLEVEYGLT